MSEVDPLLLGASLVLKGLPDFTFVPPGARLVLEVRDDGAPRLFNYRRVILDVQP